MMVPTIDMFSSDRRLLNVHKKFNACNYIFLDIQILFFVRQGSFGFRK